MDEDRISTLPDDVLCHILSLLYTKAAVRTSVLSTRWRYLFASVTVLRLHNSSGVRESHKVRGRKFTEFVNGLLKRHNVSDIRLFDLDLSFGFYDISDFNSWISSAIRRNVRKLKCIDHNLMIKGGFRARSIVPDLFTCKTLVDLVLSGPFDLKIPESVHLPNLKTCHLSSRICFSGDGSAQRLFSGCPKLEKLNILGCYMGYRDDVELHIPSLKMFLYARLGTEEVLLSAPYLEYFEYRGGGPSVLCKGDWKSIVRANITIRKHYGLSKENMSQLANSLIEVKVLSLFSDSMELLQQSCLLLPMFNKLTHLLLHAESKAGWELLPTLLHRAPSLEVLVLHKGFIDDYIYDEITESVPLCLSQHLKEATVYVSVEDQADFKWIKFLLKTAKVLEKLTVYLNPPETAEDHCQWQDPIREEVLAFPRISETCQVEIPEKYIEMFIVHPVHWWWNIPISFV